MTYFANRRTHARSHTGDYTIVLPRWLKLIKCLTGKVFRSSSNVWSSYKTALKTWNVQKRSLFWTCQLQTVEKTKINKNKVPTKQQRRRSDRQTGSFQKFRHRFRFSPIILSLLQVQRRTFFPPSDSSDNRIIRTRHTQMAAGFPTRPPSSSRKPRESASIQSENNCRHSPLRRRKSSRNLFYAVWHQIWSLAESFRLYFSSSLNTKKLSAMERLHLRWVRTWRKRRRRRTVSGVHWNPPGPPMPPPFVSFHLFVVGL